MCGASGAEARAMGPGPDSASAAGACCGTDELPGLDAFLAEALRASEEDKKRTLVIGAPESLVRAEETEDLLAMRADFVLRVLQHEVLCMVGRDCEVKAEYVMPIPCWRTGRDGMGAERVEVNFLHVEFADAGQAAALLALFNAHCPGPTGGLDVAWGAGKHVVRLAMEGEAARVMKGSAGVEGDVELTRHPVWRAAVSGRPASFWPGGTCCTGLASLRWCGSCRSSRSGTWPPSSASSP